MDASRRVLGGRAAVRRLGVGFLLLVSVLSGGRAAALTTVEFEGVLDDLFLGPGIVSTPWPALVGHTGATGSFAYDETASGTELSPDVWIYSQGGAASIDFEIAADGTPRGVPGFQISTFTGSSPNLSFVTLQEPAPPGLGVDFLEVWIQLVGGPPGSVLPGVLPTGLDDVPWSVRRTLVVHGVSCDSMDCSQRVLDWRLTFDLTSLEPVPEPGTASLLAPATLACHVLRRRAEGRSARP